MTTLANNPAPLTAAPSDVDVLIGRRLVLCWTRTQRARELGNGSCLERVRFILSVQPLDRQHAMIEAWLESDGDGSGRARTILHSTSRPCAMAGDAQLTHIDVTGTDGDCLLALSISPARGAIVYARSSLLREGGFVGGTYDPPSLQPSEGRIAQSA